MEKELMVLEDKISELIEEKSVNIYYIVADYILSLSNNEIQKLHFSEENMKLLKDYKETIDKYAEVEREKYADKTEQIDKLLKEIDKKIKNVDSEITKSNFQELHEENQRIGEALAKSNAEFEKQVNEFGKLVDEYIEEEK